MSSMLNLSCSFCHLVFAVDSIPAIFAVTRNPFIVYTSNAFAILGLRSLYFLLAAVIHRFQYLKTGIAIVLVFIGLKRKNRARVARERAGRDKTGTPT